MNKEEIELAWKEALVTQNTDNLVRLLDSAKGKRIVIDLAQLPSNIELDQWYYWFSNLGIAFINSSKNGESNI